MGSSAWPKSGFTPPRSHPRTRATSAPRCSGPNHSGLPGRHPALDTGVTDPSRCRHVRPGPEASLLVGTELGIQAWLNRGITGPGGAGSHANSAGPSFLHVWLERPPKLGRVECIQVDLVGLAIEGK